MIDALRTPPITGVGVHDTMSVSWQAPICIADYPVRITGVLREDEWRMNRGDDWEEHQRWFIAGGATSGAHCFVDARR